MKGAPIIEVQNLSFSFNGTLVLKDVNFTIGEGDFLAMIGPNGGGKTTLLRIIAGFTKPDSGVLTIEGRRVENLPPSKREIGFVFQSYALFPTQTIAQNIGFSLSIRRTLIFI